MANEEKFQVSEGWRLQGIYKEKLHERIQNWGSRVEKVINGLEEEHNPTKADFLRWLMSSVERDDRLTANVVEALDGYATEYCEGPGPYGRGGGSVESAPGQTMCHNQFEGLFHIFESGQNAVLIEDSQ